MSLFAITTGDPDGIGPEVTVKALLSQRTRLQGATPVIFRSSESDGVFKQLDRKFRRHVVSSLSDALDLGPRSRSVIEIIDETAAPFWVEAAAKACLKGFLRGLVTGPLSKTLIHDCGLDDVGHTEILGRLSGKKSLFQAYLGDSFNVVLATAHLPLQDVARVLKAGTLAKAIVAADELRRRLPAARRSKPLGVVGLNPHAGEGGLIGTEEVSFIPVLRRLRGRGLKIDGPLVPDAAFVDSQWDHYAVYVATYHDQGLIPFKMVHGRSGGAHLTLGLPFVRTSVDHGTAKAIVGRGIADPGSMIDAIKWCLQLTGKDA